MSIESYFKPAHIKSVNSHYQRDSHRLENHLCDDTYNLAIIGVEQGINSLENQSCSKAPDAIRRELYALTYQFDKLKIKDFGNIINGDSSKDTYIALTSILEELLSQNIICIVLGGSQDLSLPIFHAIKNTQKKTNISIIDSRIDIGKEDQDFNSFSFISHLLKDEKLGRLQHIAHQSYYTPTSHLELLDKYNHSYKRLGLLRKNIESVEVFMRDSDFASLDMAAVKQSDSPAHYFSSPNGLNSEEICKLGLLAGYSDRLKVFGMFELNPNFDKNGQTSSLAAQVIWHFLEGVNNRQDDYPKRNLKEYKQYFVEHHLIDESIVFYQNEFNNRWWIEVPNKNNKKEVFSCNFEEYKDAKSGKIPEIWFKYYKK